MLYNCTVCRRNTQGQNLTECPHCKSKFDESDVVTEVLYWWNSEIKEWTVQNKNSNGDQIGFCEYAPNKTALKPLLERVERETGVKPTRG